MNTIAKVPLVRKFLHVGELNLGDEISNITIAPCNDLPTVGQQVVIHSAASLLMVGLATVIGVHASDRTFDVKIGV
jgi:hypothetical protein